MKTRNQRTIVTVLLSLVLLCSLVWGIIAGTATTIQAQGAGGSLTRVNNLDLSSLRNQYFADSVRNSTENYTGERWVIVELTGDTLYGLYEKSSGYADFAAYCASEEGTAARAALEARQAEFLSRLSDEGMQFKTKYSYTTINNGVSLYVNAENYRALAKMDGVSGVYMTETYAVPKVAVKNNANVYTTGIYDTTGIDFKGEGMVVAILDTGLDYTHEAFATMPTNPKWSRADIAAKMAAAGDAFYAKASADAVYYNRKVPFAYDYADDDADVYPQYSSHGTHVAGIVAGKSGHVVNDATNETFLGVAPEAQLVICKVFTDNLDSDSLGGANNMDILAAISDCCALGVDVINMSLGSSAGFSDEKSNTFFNEIYAKVKASGISLVVAASNDYSSGFGGGNGTNLATNPDSGTVGSPSTYDAALSVASINGQKATYIIANRNGDDGQVAFITEASDENGNEYDFVEQLYRIAGKSKGELLNFKYVVVSGVGRSTNYTSPIKRALADKDGYDGTIALIRRGDTTFAEKVQNAMDNGADACIIYNHLSGTIRMSLGEVDNPIPTCSIPMDAGKAFVANAKSGIGTLTVCSDYKAGPFMSDFSSWGPTPDLQLRPEITAHGGEITSAVAGGYDIYSGTSMAAPNMAGAVSLLRQYLKNKHPELPATELTALVNQMLMSTATIALNEEGNPYSPRKQGAGLAGIKEAIAAEGYLTVTGKDGNVRDKTKIELYDDKERTGVYTLVFTVHNLTDKAQTYLPTTYVMTETLASDGKTVAEKAYMLNDSTVTYTVGGSAVSGAITVPANGTAEVTVSIRLGDSGRKYIEDSFENGMYVEGFVSLAATGDTKITLGVPYLAFYGDWNDAPLFDYSSYELAESEKDTSIPAEDKLVASAADTKVIGRYYDDQYIISMGAYLYEQAESDVKIYPEKEKIALSMFDNEEQRTIYELYMVYAGLLRGAAYMNIEITDTATGDVVYAERMENVSKSYAAGGSNRGAPVMLEIRPDEWNLHNNGTYQVTLKGELDYPGGENPKRNAFDFTFTVDYEAPEVLDYRVRYEPYTENKQTKYRIYLDVDVYDNQYVQDVMPCYIRSENGRNTLTLVTEHPIPVYGEAGTKSTVSFEVTDIYDDYVKTGKLYLAVEDYAMNQTVYQVDAIGQMDPLSGLTLLTDDYLLDTDKTGTNNDADKTPYPIYDLSLAPNQLYKPTIVAAVESARIQNLSWAVKNGGQYVRTHGQELFAVKAGSATLQLIFNDGETTTIYAEVQLTVEGDAGTAPKPDKITLAPAVNGDKWVVDLNGTSAAIELHPNTTLGLRASVSPWYVDGVRYSWKTSNPDVVSVDQVGNITTHKKGTAYITVTADGYSLLTKTVKVTVTGDFRVLSYTLFDYYGGEECVIPENLNIMYLDEECFQYNTKLKRVVLPSTLTEIPKEAFKGCTNLEEIVIPGQCIVIGQSAFENCAKLKTVTFGAFVDRDHQEIPGFNGTITIGKYAFRNCRSLSVIENQKRMTAIHDEAFAGCTALGALDLTELRVAGESVFRDCTGLTELTLGENTAIGSYMFSGCTGLRSVTYPGQYLTAGTFNGCSKLTDIRLTADDFTGIGDYALAGTRLTTVTLPAGSYAIGESAFAQNSALRRVVLSDGTRLTALGATPFADCANFLGYEVSAANPAYSAVSGILYNKDQTELISVPPMKRDIASAIPTGVRRIAAGAFAGAQYLTSIDLSGYTSIGAYAFAGSGLTTVTLPRGTTVLAEGVFSGCRSLTTVNGAANLTEIGKQAFAGCRALREISLSAVLTIGDRAFAESGLRAVSAPRLTVLGERAFDKCSDLAEVNLPAVSAIGTRAFFSCTSLENAVLGGVNKMGSEVFRNCGSLNRVTFGSGTTLVGDYAFFSTSGANRLTTVILPDGVLTIGDFAFTNQTALTGLNLASVTSIGKYAFLNNRALTSVDLTRAVTIDDGAFQGAGLTAAVLPAARVIGAHAFSAAPLTSVTFGSLERVGDYAFADTCLTTVTLPATFTERYYDYSWNVPDEKGRIEETKTRRIPTFGTGAFASIPTLKEILVAGEGAYRSENGVLYAVAADGLVLVQYPAGRAGTDYAVAAGTVEIGAAAFEGVDGLTSVTFPYSLARIGSYAFYNSTVSHFTFNSVQAPVLLSEYVSPASVSGDSILTALFGDANNSVTVYYANFYDFVAKRLYLPNNTKDFELHMIIPKNGVGYDTDVWTGFFTDIQTTDVNLPDNTSHRAMEAIDAALGLMTPEQIAACGSLADLADVIAAWQEARVAYNQVALKEQLALLADRYETLLRYEAALRAAKERLGAPVTIRELVLASIPDKIRYTAGESFDPTGMTIKAIYTDGSEVILTDYRLDKTVLAATDTYVLVTVTDHGTDYTVKVLLNVQANGGSGSNDPITPVDPEPPEQNGGMPAWAIVLIVVACVALIGGGVATVVIVRKKKG